MDFDLIDIISDGGISAKNLQRPGTLKAIKMAQKKNVDAAIGYKLDRMFCSTVDALETTKQFDR